MKSSFERVLLCLLLALATARAQDQNQAPAQPPAAPSAPAQPVPAPPAPAPSDTPPASGATTPAATPAATATSSRTPEVSSTVDTGNKLSFEPMYWFTKGIPVLRAGNTWLAGAGTSPGPLADNAANPGNLSYTGQLDHTPAFKVSIPVSKNATIRVSYFQTRSFTGLTLAPGNMNLFGQPITGGDALATSYNTQGYKLSYDYLTYFWKRGNSELRLKTLYEIQRINVSNEADDIQVDSTGAVTNINPIIGSQSVFLPTFGLGVEHTLGRHFRWEARATAFGLLHRGDIVDAEAQIAFRVSHIEVLGGGRWLHFKTSPNAAQYNVEDLYGPYVGLRYYWRKN